MYMRVVHFAEDSRAAPVSPAETKGFVDVLVRVRPYQSVERISEVGALAVRVEAGNNARMADWGTRGVHAGGWSERSWRRTGLA